eukprot:377644-Amphidinium_carterae.1
MVLSGAGSIWLDTPSEHYGKDEVIDSDGQATKPMLKHEVEAIMRQNYRHVGIVKGKRDDFAIR